MDFKNKEPGLYDDNGMLVKSWKRMLDEEWFNVTEDGNMIIPMETKFPGHLRLDDSVKILPREMNLHRTELHGLYGYGVEEMREGCNDGAENLKYLELPNCKKAGPYAIADCAVETLDLSGLEEYPEGLCRGCVNLKSVKLNPDAKRYNNDAFRDCISLEKINDDNHVPGKIFGENVFGHDIYLREISIDENAKYNHNTFGKGITVKKNNNDISADIHNQKPEKPQNEFSVTRNEEKMADMEKMMDDEIKKSLSKPMVLDMNGQEKKKQRDFSHMNKKPEPKQKPGKMTDEKGKAISDRDWSWCNPRGFKQKPAPKHDKDRPTKKLPELPDQKKYTPTKKKVLPNIDR